MTRLFFILIEYDLPCGTSPGFQFSILCERFIHPAKGLFIQLARINEMVGMTCLAVFDLRGSRLALVFECPG